MGKKIESVKNKSKEGTETFKKSSELGKKAVGDVKKMKGLIDSLPTDVDDEIAAAAKTVEQGTKTDAEGYMQNTVSSKLETGKKSMSDSTKEADSQVKNNERVKATFAQMDSVGAFGKAARDQGRTAVDSSTNEFNKAIAANNEQIRKAEEDYKKDLGDISSTF